MSRFQNIYICDIAFGFAMEVLADIFNDLRADAVDKQNIQRFQITQIIKLAHLFGVHVSDIKIQFIKMEIHKFLPE